MSDGEESGGGASTTTARKPPPSQAATQPPPAPLKETKVLLRVRVGERRRGEPPWQKAQTPRPHSRRTAYEGRRRPQTHQPPQDRHRPSPPTPPTKTDTPKVGGATAEKKDDSPNDPIIGTVAHGPYPTGVEKGTVRGVHGRKGGAVWVEYPGGTTLYEVARPLLFPTPEEAERYREEAGRARKSPNPPAPTNEETNIPYPNPTTEPTHPANPPSGPTKTWDEV